MALPFVLSPAVIEYVQRTGADPFSEVAGGGIAAVPPDQRRMFRIDGIGVRRKAASEPVTGVVDAPPLEQVLVGMSAARLPIAFQLTAAPGHVKFRLGVWRPRSVGQGGNDRAVDDAAGVMNALLRGAYPGMRLFPEASAPPRAWPRAGLLLGAPTIGKPDPTDSATPVHRLVRALGGQSWQVLVLAEPVGDLLIHNLRDQLLNDSRLAAAAEAASGVTNPLRQYFDKLVQARLGGLADGQSMGYWRTAMYLLADETSYPALTATAAAVFSGEESVVEPLRIYDDASAGRWAAQWAVPDAAGVAGPVTFRHPFAAQTMLSSRQLAAFVHLPDQEIPGFQVLEQPVFDVVPSTVVSSATSAESKGMLSLGTVVDGSAPTAEPYAVPSRALTKHALVAGTTGSGKTNTVLGTLYALDRLGVPFLVIEPAKSEYRSLLAHAGMGDRVQVFTPGTETVAPFRLNPFEVGPGESVAGHLDLLRAAFNAGFGMWTPLPQVLEQCLHEVYTDAGWDLATDQNYRLAPGEASTFAFPTLSDLMAKVPEVTHRLGYEERIESDIRAALVTRLRALCVGGKGAMLDVARSIPMEVLLSRPTVLELEWLGDDDDKALLMGLLLIRIAEHRRARGESAELVHVTVIEEAHRLLSRTGPRTSEESADPRGRAVETFVNLLAEIRAYGEGIVVADQVPLRLAPEILKNTNLKVGHRTVSAEDREALAGAMKMSPEQSDALTSLPPGRAAIFSGGDDAPLLVDIVDVKDQLAAARPDNMAVAARMAAWRERVGLRTWLFPQPFCERSCPTDRAACRAAQLLVSDDYLRRTFARTVLSMVEDASSLDRLWLDLVNVVRTRRSPSVSWDSLLGSFLAHAADWYVRHRGAQAGWTFAETADLGERLRAVLSAKLAGDPLAARLETHSRAGFVEAMKRLHARTEQPYPACQAVCQLRPPVCLYRHAVADVIATGRYDDPWHSADIVDSAAAEFTRVRTWEVCQDGGYEVVEFPELDVPTERRDLVAEAARRASLCFAQQMLAADQQKVPRTIERIMNQTIKDSRG